MVSLMVYNTCRKKRIRRTDTDTSLTCVKFNKDTRKGMKEYSVQNEKLNLKRRKDYDRYSVVKKKLALFF